MKYLCECETDVKYKTVRLDTLTKFRKFPALEIQNY
jgi:hypothetical protein